MREIHRVTSIPIVITFLKANDASRAHPIAVKAILVKGGRQTVRECVVSKGIKRGIIERRHHFHLIFFRTLNQYRPRFLGTRFQLVAHGFKLHTQVVLTPWHIDAMMIHIGTILLHKNGANLESTTQLFRDRKTQDLLTARAVRPSTAQDFSPMENFVIEQTFLVSRAPCGDKLFPWLDAVGLHLEVIGDHHREIFRGQIKHAKRQQGRNFRA